MNIKWDANKYTEDFSFVHQYGNSVIEWIDADKGSSVLDLGCGNGALTKALQDKGYLVKGLDASGELLSIAKEKYPDIDFIQGDAADFTLPEPVDVVFSNAVFHWINKDRQQDMLQCVHNVLNENGQFVFEFGGHGNNQKIHSALAETFSEYGYCYEMPFYFPTIGEYAVMLENAGFGVQYAKYFRPQRRSYRYKRNDRPDCENLRCTQHLSHVHKLSDLIYHLKMHYSRICLPIIPFPQLSRQARIPSVSLRFQSLLPR